MISKNNEKGFTLAELLVVVAIIAVLVAVSIPIFTSKLEKAREATDVANMRAAKAAAVTAYLSNDDIGDIKAVGNNGITDANKVYYDAEKGILTTTKPATGYGKGTTTSGGTANFMGYTNSTDASGKSIQVTVNASGEVTEVWN